MEYPEYLYHYTNTDALYYILKNRTIRFKSLLNVDDIEEAETRDMGNYGKFCYVSCWTDSSAESIPLWSMYSGGMKGLRIKLPAFPFVKYNYLAGQYFFSVNCESHIDYNKIYSDNRATVTANNPKLIKVEYTNNEDLLYPKISKIDATDNKSKIMMNGMGKYKRACWEFQHEWRYVIIFYPVSEKQMILDVIRITNLGVDPKTCDDLVMKCFNKNSRILLDKNTPIPYDYFDLQIKQEFLDDIEIMTGPKSTESDKKFVELLTKEYCKNAHIKESNLRIR